MKRMSGLILVLVLTAALFAACGGSGGAGDGSEWPNGTITVVVPFSGGGDTDTYARALCEQLSRDLGANFSVVNTTGGSGLAASVSVLDAKPDGNTVLFHHTGVMLTQEAAGSNPFSFLDDFEICATAARDDTCMLVVKKDAGYGTLEDFIAWCRERPGEVRFSCTFNGTTHAVASLMERTMGITLDCVDVGSSASDRLVAFMAGQCDCLVINYMNVRNYVDSGDFLVLGVCAEARPAGLEAFPTLKEQGYDVVQSKLYELRFPKGTDPAIVEKLSKAVERAAASEEFRSALVACFAEPYYRSGADTKAQDAAEIEALIRIFD